MTRRPLIEAIQQLLPQGRRRFHVPGHGGKSFTQEDIPLSCLPSAVYEMDLTELDELDVLSEPTECLKEAQESAAQLFGVQQSYFLVNGASVGIQAAMLASVKPGDRVLVPRNVHRSVVSGLILTGAEPIWFLPEFLPEWGLWGAVTTAQVQQQLDQEPGTPPKALILSSPTYEGIGSDINSLATFCREKGMLCIVDEAHGSLWPLSTALPPSACHSPADVVIHSLHKSGTSLTQSALLHLPHGSQLDGLAIQQALNTLQTTSPSYVLMASLDESRGFLASDRGQEQIQFCLDQTWELRKSLKEALTHFQLYKNDNNPFWDFTRLYLSCRNVNQLIPGDLWGTLVEEEWGLSYESASPYGVLYLATLGLNPSDYKTFVSVVKHLDGSSQLHTLFKETTIPLTSVTGKTFLFPHMELSPREAFFAPGETIQTEQAIGRIAKETVVHCPPGIPIVIPGERIQATHLSLLPTTIHVVL